MKSVIITGVMGFIGSHIGRYLSELGYEVIGLDITDSSCGELNKFYEVDLSSNQIEDIVKKHRPDFCIHCAGPASVANSLIHLENDFMNTVLPTFNLLYAVKNGSPHCKVIYISSAAVYGNPTFLPVSEGHPVSPISPYGFHKAHAENICREFHVLYRIPISIVRIFSAYGNGLKKQLMWDLCVKASQYPQVELFGSGNETRDFINIADISAAIGLVMEKSPFQFDIYNIGNGEQTKIKEIASILSDELPGTPRVFFNGKCRVGDPLYWVADIGRLKDLGYRQKVCLTEGVRQYVKWFKDQ